MSVVNCDFVWKPGANVVNWNLKHSRSDWFISLIFSSVMLVGYHPTNEYFHVLSRPLNYFSHRSSIFKNACSHLVLRSKAAHPVSRWKLFHQTICKTWIKESFVSFVARNSRHLSPWEQFSHTWWQLKCLSDKFIFPGKCF